MATIIIEKQTRSKLRNVGLKNQTYDDIINDLLEESKKRSINSTKSTEPKMS